MTMVLHDIVRREFCSRFCWGSFFLLFPKAVTCETSQDLWRLVFSIPTLHCYIRVQVSREHGITSIGVFLLMSLFLIRTFSMLLIAAMNSCFLPAMSFFSPSKDPSLFTSLHGSAFFFPLFSMVCSILSALI